MKKFKAFSSLDLVVVIGLILVLFGASLTVVSKSIKKSNDTKHLSTSSQIFSLIKKYYDSNFNLYPLPQNLEDQTGYNYVVLSSPDANFLKINLGPKYSELIDKTEFSSNLVYVYKSDGSEAAVVVRKLEVLKDKCNISEADAPNIIKDFALRDPSSCYYQTKL